jgi:lysophospholipase
MIPSLASRFLPPEGWQSGFFTSRGHRLAYGYVVPDTAVSAVVILGGRSEFSEKYFETARDIAGRGHAVFTLDWYGQGRSERLPGFYERDWNMNFEGHVTDLVHFVSNIITPLLPSSTPLYMLAHSMGGHIGLRTLMDHPGLFAGAGFSAPMLGLKAVACLPVWLSVRIATLFPASAYIPGGGDWHPEERAQNNIFSSDPDRNAVHNAWVISNPDLRLGGATFGWVAHALMSCQYLFAGRRAESVTLPCFFASAGSEALVDNKAIERMARRIPGARYIHLPNARHEILMETDEIRQTFLDGFDTILAHQHHRITDGKI